jgi:hypothetical protein
MQVFSILKLLELRLAAGDRSDSGVMDREHAVMETGFMGEVWPPGPRFEAVVPRWWDLKC